VPTTEDNIFWVVQTDEYEGGSEFEPVILARDWPVSAYLEGLAVSPRI